MDKASKAMVRVKVVLIVVDMLNDFFGVLPAADVIAAVEAE